MQKKQSFEESLRRIVEEDQRYPKEAYVFLRLALNFSIKTLNKPVSGPARHISGQELLEGIRLYTLQEFGPIARTVLKEWGITRTEDFGNIVFNMVRHGLLGKTDQDKIEDFANSYTFQDAFTNPFLPDSARKAKPAVKPARPARKSKKGTSP
jgi:uncharacterized repeat protein (TIGR04138 family)